MHIKKIPQKRDNLLRTKMYTFILRNTQLSTTKKERKPRASKKYEKRKNILRKKKEMDKMKKHFGVFQFLSTGVGTAFIISATSTPVNFCKKRKKNATRRRGKHGNTARRKNCTRTAHSIYILYFVCGSKKTKNSLH